MSFSIGAVEVSADGVQRVALGSGRQYAYLLHLLMLLGVVSLTLLGLSYCLLIVRIQQKKTRKAVSCIYFTLCMIFVVCTTKKDMRRVDFRVVDFRRVDFRRDDFRRDDFRRDDFRRVDFRRVDFRRVDFRRVDFRRVDFRRVYLAKVAALLFHQF